MSEDEDAAAAEDITAIAAGAPPCAAAAIMRLALSDGRLKMAKPASLLCPARQFVESDARTRRRRKKAGGRIPVAAF